jgi:hypothetical protein
MIDQTFTFIDPAGNQAQYTVYDADRHNNYHWATDHGDTGFDSSFSQAQDRARTALKSSMAARRRLSKSSSPAKPFDTCNPRGHRDLR